MIQLYYAPSTCAMASHLLLEHAQADYTAVRIDLKSGQQRSPEYLRLNPKGRVPALVTERGVLTETPAILLYICQLHPQLGLAPLDDPFALAQAQAFNSYLCSTVHVAHAHGRRAARWADDAAAQAAMAAKVAQNMGECFELIERELLRGPWVLGERFSLCDPYLFTLTTWLPGDGVAIERFPRVAEHHRRLQALPAAARVLPLHA